VNDAPRVLTLLEEFPDLDTEGLAAMVRALQAGRGEAHLASGCAARASATALRHLESLDPFWDQYLRKLLNRDIVMMMREHGTS
jgi:hypothetical protein